MQIFEYRQRLMDAVISTCQGRLSLYRELRTGETDFPDSFYMYMVAVDLLEMVDELSPGAAERCPCASECGNLSPGGLYRLFFNRVTGRKAREHDCVYLDRLQKELLREYFAQQKTAQSL